MPPTELFSISSLTIFVGLQKITNMSIAGFRTKIKLKLETEKCICTKNKTLKEFCQKWALLFTV